MKPSQNVQFCTTYRLYILCCFTFSFHILSRIKRLPTRTSWAVHLLQFLDDLQFSGDFFNYECFSLLNFKLILPISPVMNIYIYVYRFQIMFILFSWRLMCFFCFPMCSHEFRPGRCSSGAIDGPGRCCWWWLWLSIAGLGGSDLAPWLHGGSIVMGLPQ